jgi:hypothetical protein
MGPHVVVALGRFFETARVTQLGAASVRLAGGWLEPALAGTLSVLVGTCEVEARIVEKGPKYLKLVPAEGGAWPESAHRAWLAAVQA